MSLWLKLILVFAGVFTLAFCVVGYAAASLAGGVVESGLTARFHAHLSAIRANPAFFVHEAPLRERDFRQLARIPGFEIIVATADAKRVTGSSLPAGTAREVLALLPAEERFTVTAAGVAYRGARAVVTDRLLVLLGPAKPVEDAKRAAQRPILAGMGVALVAAILLGIVLAATITRPLRTLAERASLVRDGRLDVDIPGGGGAEVERLSGAFREMLAGLARYRDELVSREKMATLGQFSAAVAHELRNPLSSMRMTLEILRPRFPPDARDDAEFLLAEMARLDHSVEELLFHAGNPRYVFAQFDLREAVRGPLRMLAPMARHLGVGLVGSGLEGPVRCTGDEGKLAQAVTNLVLNALQASPSGESVFVAVSAGEGRGAAILVTDRGNGVPPDLAADLFRPFVSGREGGTGLGLFVTRAIARAHGGDVRWRRLGAVTEFSILLPGKDLACPASS
jgi:signal transduction histidine kinase